MARKQNFIRHCCPTFLQKIQTDKTIYIRLRILFPVSIQKSNDTKMVNNQVKKTSAGTKTSPLPVHVLKDLYSKAAQRLPVARNMLAMPVT